MTSHPAKKFRLFCVPSLIVIGVRAVSVVPSLWGLAYPDVEGLVVLSV